MDQQHLVTIQRQGIYIAVAALVLVGLCAFSIWRFGSGKQQLTSTSENKVAGSSDWHSDIAVASNDPGEVAYEQQLQKDPSDAFVFHQFCNLYFSLF